MSQAGTVNASSGGGGSYISLSPYIVGSDTHSGFSTIQSAINQAVTDGAGSSNPLNIYIKPGTYTQNLTLHDGINLIGMQQPFTIPSASFYSADNEITFTNPVQSQFDSVSIVGTITHSSSGANASIQNVMVRAPSTAVFAITGANLTLINVFIYATDINTFVLAGGGTINMFNCFHPYIEIVSGIAVVHHNGFFHTAGDASSYTFNISNCTIITLGKSFNGFGGPTNTVAATDSVGLLVNDSKITGTFTAIGSLLVDAVGTSFGTNVGDNAGQYMFNGTNITGIFQNCSLIILNSFNAGFFQGGTNTVVDCYTNISVGSNQAGLGGGTIAQYNTSSNRDGVNGGGGPIITSQINGAQNIEYFNTVQTTDATVTNIFHQKLYAQTMVIKGYVMGNVSDSSNRVGGDFLAVVYYDGGGAAQIQGSPLINVFSSSAATFNVSIGGSYLNVTVTGVAATTYNWTCCMHVTPQA